MIHTLYIVCITLHIAVCNAVFCIPLDYIVYNHIHCFQQQQQKSSGASWFLKKKCNFGVLKGVFKPIRLSLLLPLFCVCF